MQVEETAAGHDCLTASTSLTGGAVTVVLLPPLFGAVWEVQAAATRATTNSAPTTRVLLISFPSPLPRIRRPGPSPPSPSDRPEELGISRTRSSPDVMVRQVELSCPRLAWRRIPVPGRPGGGDPRSSPLPRTGRSHR